MEKKNDLYREESIESINSPDDFNKTVKVSTPGIWVFLLSIAFLVFGFLVWSFVGTIEVKYSSGASIFSTTEGNQYYLFIKEDLSPKVAKGQEVRLGGKSTTIESIPQTPIYVTEQTIVEWGGSMYLLHLIGLKIGDFVYPATLKPIDLKADVYKADIVTEHLSPITLLFK